jgi:hypothetical protein
MPEKKVNDGQWPTIIECIACTIMFLVIIKWWNNSRHNMLWWYKTTTKQKHIKVPKFNTKNVERDKLEISSFSSCVGFILLLVSDYLLIQAWITLLIYLQEQSNTKYKEN